MATSKVYSGRKSAVLIKSNIEVFPIETATDLVGFEPRLYQVVFNTGDADITGATGTTLAGKTIKSGEALLCTSVEKNTWILVTGKNGGISERDGVYSFYFIVPSANNFNLTNTAEVAEWVSFGSVYRNKMPTIMDWSATSAAKVDFGDSGAQLFIYRSLLVQRRVEAFFFLGIRFEEGEDNIVLDETKSTYFHGDCYLTDFSIDAAPDNVADLSLNFAGDGELKAVINGEIIVTDWNELLGD
jgi:hypothetical protein